MTQGSADGPAGPDELAARVERLERRVERERSARREAERIAEDGLRELFLANQQLEQRVVERTAALEATLAATKVAAAAKERFLAELGHELNTPLHNVLGLLELIEPSRLVEEDRRRLDEVRAHADDLAGLLAGLIELAAADGAPAPADVVSEDPVLWLDELVAFWTRPAAHRAQLLVPTIIGATGEPVRLDWRRMRRAADAVVSNATTHADAGVVEVVLVGGEDTVTLRVTDPGPGLVDDVADTATEPFVSAGPSAGVGVGLAVARMLVESAGGSLTIGAGAAGTVVEMTLPTAP